MCATHSCVYEYLCLHICTSFERQSLLCFKLHFFQLQRVARSSLRGMCARARIFAYETSLICTMPHATIYLSLASLVEISVDFFYRVTFRLPPMNPVGERGASLHTPQNSKANHPCRSQQSVQLWEKKAARHQQAPAIPAGWLSFLCCPPNSICTGMDWITLFAKTYFYLMIVLIIHLPGTINGIDLDLQF